MHDDRFLVEQRLARVLRERIRPAIYATAVPLRVERWDAPDEPVPVAEGLAAPYSPAGAGEPWGPPWGTTWFRLTGEVPESWTGQTVEVVVDLGFDIFKTGFSCEGLVYTADGQVVKGLNPRNAWVRIADAATGGERIEYYVEAAANPTIDGPVSPMGDKATAGDEPIYRLNRADVAVFDEQVWELVQDLEVLEGLMHELSQDSERRWEILRAIESALDAIDLWDVPGTAKAARQELDRVLTKPAHPSAHTVSAVGHAHIDSAWLWPLRETVRKVARTAANVTSLMDDHPELVFAMSQAQQLAWIKEHRPEVYARVKEAVAAGRFLPLGGMWVESDTVMPTGEAMVRQFSQGQRFFEREFGIRPKGVWLPDSFGYSPALPQLMRRAGFEWFFTQKISWNQVNVFPHHTFLWEGIDGSRVFTHFPPMDTYNSQLSGEEVAKATRQFRESRRATGSIAPVGWGDGGGGTTREMVGKAERLADLEGSAKVRWEHPDDFYARTRAELSSPPVWAGELYLELHRATLTSQHKTKQGNRRSEHLLIEAEAWCATAAATAGFDYPYDELDELWQRVLLHQFHDILPGTSIAWVHREAVAVYEEIRSRTEAVIARALAALVGEGEQEIRANPAPVARGGVNGLSARPATDLPEPTPVHLQETDAGYVLDNGFVTITISREGHVTSAVDRISGRDAIAPGREAGVLQLHQDFPNKWDAWDVDSFYRNNVTDLREVTGISATVRDDGAAAVTVSRAFGDSSLEQVISLEPGSRTLRFAQTTDWHEAEKFLKVAFPLDVRAEHTAAETQFGHQKRVTHTNTSWEAAKFETSMHRYVLAEEPGFGVALVNDSVYGYDVTRDVDDTGHDTRVSTTVRLSLLRAPRFPDPETDQGPQTVTYGLVVGADVADATRAGLEMNLAERRVTGGHGFDPIVKLRPDSGPGELVISSVKLADDRSGDLVVRVYEALGARATGTLAVGVPVSAARTVSLIEDDLDGADLPVEDGTLELALEPFEVRTLRLARA